MERRPSVTAVLKVVRQPLGPGRRGRPRLVLPARVQVAQVVKHAAQRHVVGVTCRVMHGALAGIEPARTATATSSIVGSGTWPSARSWRARARRMVESADMISARVSAASGGR